MLIAMMLSAHQRDQEVTGSDTYNPLQTKPAIEPSHTVVEIAADKTVLLKSRRNRTQSSEKKLSMLSSSLCNQPQMDGNEGEADSQDGFVMKRIYFCTKNGLLLELSEADPPRWINHGKPPGADVAAIVNAPGIRAQVWLMWTPLAAKFHKEEICLLIDVLATSLEVKFIEDFMSVETSTSHKGHLEIQHCTN
ncbi:unnamed protein product [Lactuca virosa]|uniref:Uncharacterized protein n=1 Tax=Lactuca virosa TaxID=75947 RepID=A0AAU9NZN3_9ASTR|nr:unnamed protein product [Lactuca virosa]